MSHSRHHPRRPPPVTAAQPRRLLVQDRDISGSDLSNNPDGPAIFSGQGDR
jgi:hypothetical protein